MTNEFMKRQLARAEELGLKAPRCLDQRPVVASQWKLLEWFAGIERDYIREEYWEAGLVRLANLITIPEREFTTSREVLTYMNRYRPEPFGEGDNPEEG